MPGEFSKYHCPKCGSLLLIQDLGEGPIVWCSNVGGENQPGCRYGLSQTITLQRYLATDNAEALQMIVMGDILRERNRQDKKWGEQNHDPVMYLAILVEEVGEFAQAALHNKFGGSQGSLEHLREEAIQVAAVAMAIVECLDREKWRWSNA